MVECPPCHDENHMRWRDAAWNQRLSNEIRLRDSLVCLASLQQNRNEILEAASGNNYMEGKSKRLLC